MIRPAAPVNEASRLAALRSLDLLGTPAEDRFDRLTRLARRVFDVPMAWIGLVDAERVWLKSADGVGNGAVPRELSFCGHAILSEEALVVTGAAGDERFLDNPLVTDGPRILFYAGCPLTAPDGSRVGTLAVADQRPRDFGDVEHGLLHDLARLAEQEIAAAQRETHDALTGLPNRRGLLTLGQPALSLCGRVEAHASLCYFRVDDLAGIGSEFGAEAVDHVLQTFAGLLRRTFRETDVVGRVGADAFAALMTNCPESLTELALQRLQRGVDADNHATARGYEIHYTAGMASYEPIRHSSVEALLCHARELMLRSPQVAQAA